MTDSSAPTIQTPLDVVSAALNYAARGWRVLPLHAIAADGACTCDRGPGCPSAGKHPIPKRWQDTPPLSNHDIANTWQLYPYANVGVATGEPSGFFVLDIDPDGGGFESMTSLVETFGPLPATATQRTGSGGYHYFFALPDFEVRNSQKKLGRLGPVPGLDIRGNGGQIVIAPSRSGKGGYVFNDLPIAPAPAWLLDALRPEPEAAPPPVSIAPVQISEADQPRLTAYVQSAVDSEIARLHDLSAKGWNGDPWNNTTFLVACNLVELANSPWTGLTHEHVDQILAQHAPRDATFGEHEISKCLWSARQRIGTQGRQAPAARAQDSLFAGIPVAGPVAQAPGAPAAAPQPMGTKHTWDDLGNAHRIYESFGSMIRWVDKDKSWAVYDGKAWRFDSDRAVTALIQRRIENLVAMEGHLYSDEKPVDEEGMPDPKGKSEAKQFVAWAAKQRMTARVEAAEKAARSHPALQAAPAEFDRHPMLLNVRNGVVDLTRGLLLPHDPALLLSQIADVDFVPNTPAPMWEAFLARVMPDPAMRGYLQRALGYSISGDISAQAMFMHTGKGANGKSVMLVVIQRILGDYNQIVPRTTMLAKADNAVPTDIARMVGKRVLQTSETAHGKRMDEEIVKSLTGGEGVTARHLYGKEFEFTPTGKVHYVTNHLPKLSDAESIWRRLHLFHWRVTIPEAEQVANLGELMAREEGSGILSWLVAGCLSWQQIGLGRPETSAADLLAYRTEQDEFGEFVDDHLIATAGARTSLDLIYRAYNAWTSQSGQGRPMTRQTLSLALRERGYVSYRTGRERGFVDVTVSLPVATPATILGGATF